MQSVEINDRIRRSLTQLIESADELRDLDQALGDGDLGITVTAGSRAVIEALEALPSDASPTQLARTCASAFANANPSTMAALVAGALLSGSRTWDGKDDITLADTAAFVRAAANSISSRGKTELGDKTILDGLSAVADVLESAPDSATAIQDSVAAARRAVVETKDLQSRRGRASWLQERSIGLIDPGAMAFQRLIEAWAELD